MFREMVVAFGIFVIYFRKLFLLLVEALLRFIRVRGEGIWILFFDEEGFGRVCGMVVVFGKCSSLFS